MTKPTINLQNISLRYTRGGNVDALTDVTLSTNAGEFVALFGPSGCGKTTLLSIIGGLLKPTSGKANINGSNPYERTPNQRAAWRAENISFLFQQFNLLPFLTAHENVCAQALARPRKDRGTIRTEATKLLERFGLNDRLHHLPGRMSVGEQQRVAIARAIVAKPAVILADEPTGNLDSDSADNVFKILRELANDGHTVIVATHDERSTGFADRVIKIESGRIEDKHPVPQNAGGGTS